MTYREAASVDDLRDPFPPEQDFVDVEATPKVVGMNGELVFLLRAGRPKIKPGYVAHCKDCRKNYPSYEDFAWHFGWNLTVEDEAKFWEIRKAK